MSFFRKCTVLLTKNTLLTRINGKCANKKNEKVVVRSWRLEWCLSLRPKDFIIDSFFGLGF